MDECFDFIDGSELNEPCLIHKPFELKIPTEKGMNSVLRIYTGSKPASPDMTACGTLLAQIYLNLTWYGSALRQDGNSASTVRVPGTAGYARLETSHLPFKVDIPISTTGIPGCLTFPRISFTEGETINITNMEFTIA